MEKINVKKVRRNVSDRIIAGVCSGIGQAYNFNPLWLRLLFILLTIYLFPWALVVYLLAAIIIPKENVAFEEIKYKKFIRIKNNKLIGGVCTGLQEYLGIDVVLIRLAFIALIPVYGVGVILYVAMWAVSPIKELKTLNKEEIILENKPE